MQRATQSKERTEKATVIELAQTDILGQIAENKGETISETQLKTILTKYFEEFDDELTEDLSETTITLTAKEEYGGYANIALADIYNGNLKIEVLHTYHIEAVISGTYSIAYLYDENNNKISIADSSIASVLNDTGVAIIGLSDDRGDPHFKCSWLAGKLYFGNKLSRANNYGNVYFTSCGLT